jgi:hypothetical protein
MLRRFGRKIRCVSPKQRVDRNVDLTIGQRGLPNEPLGFGGATDTEEALYSLGQES